MKPRGTAGGGGGRGRSRGRAAPAACGGGGRGGQPTPPAVQLPRLLRSLHGPFRQPMAMKVNRSLRSCEEMPEFENTIAWGDTKSLDGPSERGVGLLMRPPAVENSRFSAVLIISQLLTVAALIGPAVREGLRNAPDHPVRALAARSARTGRRLSWPIAFRRRSGE